MAKNPMQHNMKNVKSFENSSSSSSSSSKSMNFRIVEGAKQQDVMFGDFTAKDSDLYFSIKGVKQDGVEFLCDPFNATKSWVEEGSKHTFSYLQQMDLEEKVAKKLPDNVLTAVSENILLDGVNKLEENSFVPKQDESKSAPSSSPWSSLFKGSATSSQAKKTTHGTTGNQTAQPSILLIQNEQEKENKAKKNGNQNLLSLISMENDQRAFRLAEQITQLVPNFNKHNLQLRGLVNRSNWCYINTTLQALLPISAITHFYKSLKAFLNTQAKSTSTPLTDAMIAFFNEFEPINLKISTKKQSDDLRAGTSFEPRCVYDVLPVMKTSLSEKGRQEDAEEFLSFLLNGMHDELVDLKKLTVSATKLQESGETDCLNLIDDSAKADDEEDDEDAWEHVGKKNKTSTLRKSVIEESLVKHIFGGVLRSSVHQKGKKESTTLQPFFTLQLDIQSDKVWTLQDALQAYFVKENLQGFTCTTTNTEVEASRRTFLEELPLVLIFHLKYFVFDRQGGCQKLHKALDIPAQLEISKEILSADAKSKIPPSLRHYKLCSVVYHHGKNAAGGHYTASVHHGNPFNWVHFDDNNVKSVSEQRVLKHQQGCVPYLLFYERIQAR